MARHAGRFTGTLQSQAVAVVTDRDGHELTLSTISGIHTSSDPLWNGARMTYWGFADCVDGNGTQRGYFQNEHANGDREGGTFEALISTEGAQVSVHGSYEFTGGTGAFAKLRGGGEFTAHLLSETQVEMTWEGNYDVG